VTAYDLEEFFDQHRALGFLGVASICIGIAYGVTTSLNSTEASPSAYTNVQRMAHDYPELNKDIRAALADNKLSDGEYNQLNISVERISSIRKSIAIRAELDKQQKR
jgi:hypothetical protein